MAAPTEPDESLLRATLQRYDDALLATVAHKLCRPRNQWTAAELVQRILQAHANPVMLDRRIRELGATERQVLACLARSGQAEWPFASAIEMAILLGSGDGLATVQGLLESGLVFPKLGLSFSGKLKDLARWAIAPGGTPEVFLPALVLQRARSEPLELAECPGTLDLGSFGATVHESDGLEWPLRLAVLWQQVLASPLRRTMQATFFKRDADRLREDPLLSLNPHDAPAACPDPGFFAVALAVASGLLREDSGELQAAPAFPDAWSHELLEVLRHLTAALPHLQGWNAVQGHTQAEHQPHASANLLALLLLGGLAEGAWADPGALEAWMLAHHPYWREAAKGTGEAGVEAFLLGVAFPLRLVQARKQEEGWAVRLSPTGRAILGFGPPAAAPTYPQTLMVQPNLEILAYRQGLTPPLIARLSRIATWKTLGAACTLQLEPKTVYGALEAGETLESIVQLVQRHGMRELPPSVLDTLKTWANKRERLTVYASAALFEFASSADLNEALARGLPAVRLTDRLAIVASEKDIDYRHFRLTGTRDYLLPPERCVDVEPDGVTLSIDLARSDLMLEPELQRFAESSGKSSAPGRQLWRITPLSLAHARQHAVSRAHLETWFQQRTGLPMSPAVRLLLDGPGLGPVEIRKQVVLKIADPELADGLQQWPGTSGLIQARLGPQTLAVLDEHLETLAARLAELGIKVLHEA